MYFRLWCRCWLKQQYQASALIFSRGLTLMNLSACKA